MILIMNVLCQDLIGFMPVLYVRMLMMLMNLSSSGAAFRLAVRWCRVSLPCGVRLLPPPTAHGAQAPGA